MGSKPKWTCEECDFAADTDGPAFEHDQLDGHRTVRTDDGGMGLRGVLEAELFVALRAAIIGAVGYGVWTLVTGSALSWHDYGMVAGALFVAANAVFWLLKWYAPHVVDAADTVERSL